MPFRLNYNLIDWLCFGFEETLLILEINTENIVYIALYTNISWYLFDKPVEERMTRFIGIIVVTYTPVHAPAPTMLEASTAAAVMTQAMVLFPNFIFLLPSCILM